jgi:hypothetical protein
VGLAAPSGLIQAGELLCFFGRRSALPYPSAGEKKQSGDASPTPAPQTSSYLRPRWRYFARKVMETAHPMRYRRQSTFRTGHRSRSCAQSHHPISAASTTSETSVTSLSSVTSVTSVRCFPLRLIPAPMP